MDEVRLPAELTSQAQQRAYAYLLGQYLGDGCISEQRRRVFRLRITCADDWPAVMDVVDEAMSTVLPDNTVGRYRRKGDGCTEVGMSSKRWPHLLPQHGPGMKHLRHLRLADWQEAVAVGAHPALFVCGLLHSDGCRATNNVTVRGRKYSYPRYFFSNRSEDIHAMFVRALTELSISSTRSGWNQSIARRADVALLDHLGASKAEPCVLVPGAGIEPARSEDQWCLRP